MAEDPLTDKEAAEAFTKKWAYKPHNSLHARRSPTISFHSPHHGKPQCQAETASSQGNWTQFSQCSHRGKTVLADGTHWCAMHDPEAVRKRGDKARERQGVRDAKWAAQSAAWQHQRDMKENYPRLVAALREIEAGHNDARGLAAEVLAALPQEVA